MNVHEGFSCAVSCLEDVCNRLSVLVHTVDTICLGLACEKMEKQTLDCITCIGYAVKQIQANTEKMLQEMREETETE